MRRRLTILACTLAVLILAWTVPIVALNAIENKHAVDPRELIVDNPDRYSLLKTLKWTDQRIPSDVEGVYIRSWTSGKARLLQRVHRYGSSIGAFYAYSTQDPLFAYEQKARIVTPQPPPGLRADQAELFCAGFTAKRGLRHKCVAWAAWLRYGQYTVYITVSNVILSEADFASITQHADALVNRALL